MDVGMLLLSCIPAGVFIGAVILMEVIFDFIYDRSESFREWADREIYQSEESK